MEYVLVENNKISKTKLPKTGRLKDGRTVSNYNLLEHEILLKEGWLPLVKNIPEYDNKTQNLKFKEYIISKDKVEQLYEVYEIEEILPPAPTEEEIKDKAKESLQKYIIYKMINNNELKKNEILEIISLFNYYEINKLYEAGEFFVYKRSLYKVITEHTTQEGYEPDKIPELYEDYTPKEKIENWRQPINKDDGYMINDKIIFNDKIYISIIDNNVWKPNIYGWEIDNTDKPLEEKK